MLYKLDQCATAHAYEIKFDGKVNLDKLAEKFEILSKMPVVLMVKINNKPITVYASGRAMLKDVTKEEAEKIAETLNKAVD